MGIPLKIKASNLNDYLEVMSKAVFQSGLSWASIDKRWLAIVEAFKNFDPKGVAKLSEEDIGHLLDNPSLLLNEKKIKATIHNAKVLIELEAEYGGIAKYLRAFKDYSQLSADLKARFSYLGDVNIYYFLFRVGEPVPPFASWIKTVKGEHPRIKEMTELAAKAKADHDGGDALDFRRFKGKSQSKPRMD